MCENEDMIKALRQAIPVSTAWRRLPSNPQMNAEDLSLIDFIQECRERTAAMKDREKCEHCKLRFRCYTEIKVKRERKTKFEK